MSSVIASVTPLLHHACSAPTVLAASTYGQIASFGQARSETDPGKKEGTSGNRLDKKPIPRVREASPHRWQLPFYGKRRRLASTVCFL
jgi:hypothetical protein